MADKSPNGTTNRLSHEQSPYLLQHAHNPVDWYPWGNEAFDTARTLDRPVFVSIGYATCHWCHVMERESFEDADVAHLLNTHFVSVKVDREERPDVDAIYMDVCQAMTGRGGWPLTVLLDADRRPFFAGTYFPRENSHGRIGLLELLKRIHEAWTAERPRIAAQCKQIAIALSEQAQVAMGGDLTHDIFDKAIDEHTRQYDSVHGGFGRQPKFPSAHHLLFLLHHAGGERGNEIMEMVTASLDAMRAGGLYDHVGGGFHRYSTDRHWFMPHFEKMLYDQATLMLAYAEAYRQTHDSLYRHVVLDIANYLRTEMTSPTGAFYAAQDADANGVEGSTYVWTDKEIVDVVGTTRALAMAEFFGITANGTMHEEATGNPTGMNILACSPGNVRAILRNEQWQQCRVLLAEARRSKPQPLTDDKVLADWNGLMIGALAYAFGVTGEEHLLTMATEAWNDVVRKCASNNGTWFHGARQAPLNAMSMLDDHAALAWAASQLARVDSSDDWVAYATDHLEIVQREFMSANGAMYLTRQDVADLIARQRSDHDGAYPSGASMAALAMHVVGAITHSTEWQAAARSVVNALGEPINRSPYGYAMMLTAWSILQADNIVVTLHGTAEWLKEARALILRVLPLGAVVCTERGPDDSVVICRGTVCQSPLRSITEVKEALAGEQPW